MAIELLNREGYDVEPTSTLGNDDKRDAFLQLGNNSGIAHFSTRDDWENKIKEDAESAWEHTDKFDFIIFLTNQDFATTARDRVKREIEEEYGWNVEIWDFEQIRNKVLGNLDNHDLVRRHLGVNPQATETFRSAHVKEEVRNARIKTIAETIDPLLDTLRTHRSKLNDHPIPSLSHVRTNDLNTPDIAEEYEAIEEDLDCYQHLINIYREDHQSLHKQIREYLHENVSNLSEHQREQVKEIIEVHNLSQGIEIAFGNRIRPMTDEVLNDKEGKIGRYTQNFWDVLDVSVKDIREVDDFLSDIDSLSDQAEEIHNLNDGISTDVRMVKEDWIERFDIQDQEIMNEENSSETTYSY